MNDLYSIPQELQDFRELVRRISDERVAPRAAEIDREDEYPWDLRQLLGEQDVLGLPFPVEYGGTGTGTLMLQIAVAKLEHKLGVKGSPTGSLVLEGACARAERGDADLGKYSSMAKVFASDTAMAVTVEAVQVLGGYGYVTEYPVERMLRDAKVTLIYEGTNEIQRLVIAPALRRA